jgi:hypothetical protein
VYLKVQERVIFDEIIKELKETREDLFQYNIESAVQKTINLIQKLTPLARAAGKENELNKITVSLMTAMGQKDYLLFSDIACYEIPALFVPSFDKNIYLQGEKK